MTFRASRCCAFSSMAQLTNSLTPDLNRLGHRHANILAIIGRQSKVCVTYETAGLIFGRERRERVSQLTWCGSGCLDSRRRVNSNVRRPAFSRCGREWLGVGGCVAGWIEARQATRWIFPDVQARMMATI